MREVAPPVITAVNMGYGHLRAAAALTDCCGVRFERADRAPCAGLVERLVWLVSRHAYHSLSRLSQTGSRRTMAGRLLDGLTAISDQGPIDPSRRPVSVRFLDGMIRAGFGFGLGRRLEKHGRSLVTTFYANAVVAEHHSSAPVACVVTDSFVHRVWAPARRQESRIQFLVPTEGTGGCLEGYGVRAHRIHVTGFPLPPELVGSPSHEILEQNLTARLDRLGRPFSSMTDRPLSPIRVTVAVGGAGAQTDHIRGLIRELGKDLCRGRLRLTLVAGTHRWAARRFRHWVDEEIRRGLSAGSVDILVEETFHDYYREFNRLLAVTDLLWTKPSELVFYGALGLPLILEKPLGDHERHNRALVVDARVAMDRPMPGAVAETLQRRIDEGWFSTAAIEARRRLEADGSYRIRSFCSTDLVR